MATKGMGAQRQGRRAAGPSALPTARSNTPPLGVLSGLTMFHATQGRLGLAQTFGQQLLDLAPCQSDPVLVCEGYTAVKVVALYRGDLIAARTHLSRASSSPLPSCPPPPFLPVGSTPGLPTSSGWCEPLWAQAMRIRPGNAARTPWPGPANRACPEYRVCGIYSCDAFPVPSGDRSHPCPCRRIDDLRLRARTDAPRWAGAHPPGWAVAMEGDAATACTTSNRAWQCIKTWESRWDNLIISACWRRPSARQRGQRLG